METRQGEPFNFYEEVGKGFVIGSVLAPPYLFLRGGIQAVPFAPVGSCHGAVWWGAYSAILHARRKEETPALNHVLAAAGANGIALLPFGVRTAARYSLFVGAFATAAWGGLKLALGDLPPCKADR